MNRNEMKINSKRIAGNGESDDRQLVLWNYQKGNIDFEWIETNGDPVYDSEECFQELKEKIINQDEEN